MPNHQPVQIEQQIVAFALGHPAYGPDRISAELARPKWGGLRISPNCVWRVLRRHGLNTRAKRLGLVAGYRSPYAPPREYAYSALRQGATAVALAAGFDLGRGSSGVLITILLCVMVGEAIAALTPLTASPERAEVS